MEAGKKTRGRQRIPMRKIEKEGDRFATFSKRRKGLYKKASELCWLSGSDVGIVLTSPTGKTFSFFNPSPESVIGRFFNWRQFPGQSSQASDADARGKVGELYGTIDKMEAHMEVLNQRSKAIDEQIKTTPQSKTWWESPVGEFGMEDVLRHQAFLEGLQIAASAYFDVLNNGASPITMASQEQAFFSPLMPSSARNVFQN